MWDSPDRKWSYMTLSAEQTLELHRCAALLGAGDLPAGWDIVPGSGQRRVAFNREMQLYYKEFPVRSPLERLKALVLGSRAARTRRHNDALLYAGIGAPTSLAWGRLKDGKEYIFTRESVGKDVAFWLQISLAHRRGESLVLRRRLLESLGVFIGRIHATGFVPGDLQARDVQARLCEDRFQFALTNNENTTMQRPPPGKKLVQNLVQLNLLPPADLSRTDRMRFFVAWRRQLRDLSDIETKVIAAEAYHEAMRRMYYTGKL